MNGVKKMIKKNEEPNYYVEWWFPRFKGSHHKVANLTLKEAKRLFTQVWRFRSTRAVLGGLEGILKEKAR